MYLSCFSFVYFFIYNSIFIPSTFTANPERLLFMKTVITGSYFINLSSTAISDLIQNFPVSKKVENHQVSEIISGGDFHGIDSVIETWAESLTAANGKPVPILQFIPDIFLGSEARIKRNLRMADYGDCLIIIWDGVDPDIKHLRESFQVRGKPIFEIVFRCLNSGH